MTMGANGLRQKQRMKATEGRGLGTVVPECWRTVKLPRHMTGEPGVWRAGVALTRPVSSPPSQG